MRLIRTDRSATYARPPVDPVPADGRREVSRSDAPREVAPHRGPSSRRIRTVGAASRSPVDTVVRNPRTDDR